MIKFSIYKKMMLGFGAIISIMIVSSGYMLFELNSVAGSAKKILAANVRTQEIARAVIALIQDENGYIEKYQVSEDATYSNLFFETSRQVKAKLNDLLHAQSPKEEHILVQTIKKAHSALEACMLEPPGSREGIEPVRKKNISLISSCIDTLIQNNQSDIGRKMALIETATARSVKVALLLVVCTSLAAVAGALAITRTITTPVSDLIKGSQQISEGNFDPIHIRSKDEMALLADAINEMSSKIDETNQLKTRMMQQISHEIKTPLQAMQSAHDILKASNAVNNNQAHMLDTIARSVDKISGFSLQYLDLAKIQSGAMQYNMQKSRLSDIIQPIVDEAVIIAAAKKISMQFIPEETPELTIDPEKISIIVSNLITNAIKYTRQNGQVRIITRSDSRCVQIQVLDSGIGIDKDEIPQVFNRFYQASNIEKINSRGSGVGLAIVRAYTEGHGGTVSVASRPDKGSTFTIELPLSPGVSLQSEANPPTL